MAQVPTAGLRHQQPEVAPDRLPPVAIGPGVGPEHQVERPAGLERIAVVLPPVGQEVRVSGAEGGVEPVPGHGHGGLRLAGDVGPGRLGGPVVEAAIDLGCPLPDGHGERVPPLLPSPLDERLREAPQRALLDGEVPRSSRRTASKPSSCTMLECSLPTTM